MTGSSICSRRSKSSSSCLERTLIVLFLQQLSWQAKISSVPLEELEDTLEVSEDDLYNWCFSSSLGSLSGWSSFKSLKISSLIRELIGNLALPGHSFLKCHFFPQLKHFPFALGLRFSMDLGFPFL